MRFYPILTCSLFVLLAVFVGNAQPLPPAELSERTLYTSLESALKDPEQVYRLELKGSCKGDTLPPELFTLRNLQELTVKRCRLQKLNDAIGKLQYLQYLNLERNKLAVLPDSLCDLKELKVLVINRNVIWRLPEQIDRLTKLEVIEAWDNPLYFLPEKIALLSGTLLLIDLRQVALRSEEIDAMENLLPQTNILYTPVCDCKNSRK